MVSIFSLNKKQIDQRKKPWYNFNNLTSQTVEAEIKVVEAQYREPDRAEIRTEMLAAKWTAEGVGKSLGRVFHDDRHSLVVRDMMVSRKVRVLYTNQGGTAEHPPLEAVAFKGVFYFSNDAGKSMRLK